MVEEWASWDGCTRGRAEAVAAVPRHSPAVLPVDWPGIRQGRTAVHVWVDVHMLPVRPHSTSCCPPLSPTPSDGPLERVASSRELRLPPASSVASTPASQLYNTLQVFGSHGGQAYPESPVTSAAVAEGLAGGGATYGGGLVGVVGGGAATVLSAAAGASGVLTGGMLSSVGGGGGGGGSHSYLTVALGLASGHAVVLTGDIAGHGGCCRMGAAVYKGYTGHSTERVVDRWDMLACTLRGV